MSAHAAWVKKDCAGYLASKVVIHLNDKGRLPVEFDELLADLPGAFLSRADTLVVPGERMAAAMELILLPALTNLMRNRERRT